MEKRLLNTKELSKYMGTPKGSLYTMICRGRIPQACIVKMGRGLRFEKSEIDKWISAKRLSPGSFPGYK